MKWTLPRAWKTRRIAANALSTRTRGLTDGREKGRRAEDHVREARNRERERERERESRPTARPLLGYKLFMTQTCEGKRRRKKEPTHEREMDEPSCG